MPTFVILHFAQGCTESTFLTIKSWAQYVPKGPLANGCQLNFDGYGVGTIWLILAGLTDILLRIGALVAIGYFIFGAVKMVTSQGSPEAVKSSRETMVNALIGLLLSIASTWLLNFVIRVLFKV